MNQQSTPSTFYLAPPGITYKVLREEVFSEKKNRPGNCTTLTQWMVWSERMEHNEVGPELREDFLAQRNAFLKWSAGHLGPNALRNQRRGIKAIQRIYAGLCERSRAETIRPGETLRECLRTLLLEHGISGSEARQKWGAAVGSYLTTSRIPSAVGGQALAQVERDLGCRPGFLTRFVAIPFQYDQLADFAGHIDPYREGLAARLAQRYCLYFDREGICPRLKVAWEDFVDFQMSAAEVIHDALSDGLSLNLDEDTETFLPRGRKWTSNSRGEVPTAIRYLREYQSFFGWLVLQAGSDASSSGLGLDPANLSFGMVGHWGLWRRFMAFRHVRGGGGKVFSQGTSFHLMMFAKLTRPRTGWLVHTEDRWLPELQEVLQAAGLSKKVLSPGFFEQQHRLMKEWRAHNLVQFKRRRDPMETLAPFLREQSPMETYIFPLIDKLERDMPPRSQTIRRFCAERALMVIVAFFSIPLRVINWQTCEIDKQLVRDASGLFHLEVGVSEMKIRTTMLQEGRGRGYQVRVHEWAQRYFAHYVDEVLPDMPHGAHRYLLGNHINGGMLKASQLYWIFRKIFEAFFRLGIGPHAARHIVATDLLKKDPANIYAVAKLLGDTEETVSAYYAHLLDQEYIDHCDVHSSAQAARILHRHGIVELP